MLHCGDDGLIEADDEFVWRQVALGGRDRPPAGSDLLRQVLRHQDAAGFAEGDEPAQLVGELPHVAGPAVEDQILHRVFGDTKTGFLRLPAVLLEVVLNEERNLFAAFAQGWHGQPDDVEAIEEILAEASLAHHLLEVGVGGSDDADVDVDRLGLAERMNLVRLEEAKEFGLDVEPELADLVEEEGAAGGGADDAGEGLERAGECSAAIAEELRVEHVARDGGAVEGDERLVLAGRGVVQGVSEKFLAGTAFAGDEDGNGARRQPSRHVDDLEHVRRGDDHAELLLRRFFGPERRRFALTCPRFV